MAEPFDRSEFRVSARVMYMDRVSGHGDILPPIESAHTRIVVTHGSCRWSVSYAQDAAVEVAEMEIHMAAHMEVCNA